MQIRLAVPAIGAVQNAVYVVDGHIVGRLGVPPEGDGGDRVRLADRGVGGVVNKLLHDTSFLPRCGGLLC